MLLLFCAIVLGAIGIVGWVVSVADSAPNIQQLKPLNPGQVSEVYAGNGSLLGYISSQVLRTYVNQDQMPNRLRQATVAIEDRRFWHHGGVDYEGILRAGVRDLLGGGTSVQGGSTLTMQLVNNIYLPYDIKKHHNLRYKIIQAKLANQLEDRALEELDPHPVPQRRRLRKRRRPGGDRRRRGVTGVLRQAGGRPRHRADRAARRAAPGAIRLQPVPVPERPPASGAPRCSPRWCRRATSRRAQANAANASSLQVKANDTYQTVQQPYVFDYVKEQLINRFGARVVDDGGLKIYTTIDLHDQALALTALRDHESEPGDPAAALVSIDPYNGHILAMQNSIPYSVERSVQLRGRRRSARPAQPSRCSC